MHHTVIALFDDADGARQAAAALKARGFDESAVRITLNSAESDAEQVPPAARIEGGPLTGLLHRLATLFGVEEPHLSHYEEAVRRGGNVVEVEATNEAEAASARDALLAVGAVNIDDRVEEWQRAGWRGADDSLAAPGTTRSAGIVHRQEVSIGGVRVYGRPVGADEAGTGTSDEEVEPAYRHGHALASDAACAGRSWDEIEPEARSRWERLRPDQPWEQVRRAVRHGWEKATGR